MKLYELISSGKELEEIANKMVKTRNIDEKDSSGMTALMHAVMNNYSSAVELLIEEGADVDVENNDGINALDLAKRNENKKIIFLLSKAGAGSSIGEEIDIKGS